MTATEAFKKLGLDEDKCTLDEARSAYRSLARSTHPDKGGEVDDFVSVQEAYEIVHAEITARDRVCSGCGGKGRVTVASGFSSMQVTCRACSGTGLSE